MQHKDVIVLKKIIDELDFAINETAEKTFESFDENELFKRGICMTVINIGELVKNLSADFRLQYSGIPWKRIAGFRDIAAHKYATLNMKDVYNSIKYDFPALKTNILKILSE